MQKKGGPETGRLFLPGNILVDALCVEPKLRTCDQYAYFCGGWSATQTIFLETAILLILSVNN